MSLEHSPIRQRSGATPACGQDKPAEERYLLTVNDFCAKASISRATFYREVADGLIRTTRIRGRTLVPRAELERLTRVDPAR